MAQAMRIDLQFGGLNSAIQGLNRLAAAQGQVARNQQALNANSGGGGGGGGGRRPGGGAPSGPFSRLADAQRNLATALAGGNQTAIDDARANLDARQRAAARAQQRLNPQQPSFMSRAMGVISSSRIGIGGGAGATLMPLVGRLVGMLGPVGVVATVAAGALKGFADNVARTSEVLSQMHSAALTTGGNTGNIAFLKTLGIDPGTAGGVRDALSSNPMAMAQGAQMGMGITRPRGYGAAVNEAELLENAIKRLAFSSDDAAMRLANAQRMQMDALIPQIELYRRHAATIENDSAIMKQIADPATSQAAADLQFELGRLGQGFNEIMMALGKPFIQDAANFVRFLADSLKGLALVLNQNQAAVKGLIGFLSPLIGLFSMIGSALGMRASPDASALSANTKAVADNTAALRAGTFGGGTRASGAIPAGLRGMALDRALQGSAARMGAFAL